MPNGLPAVAPFDPYSRPTLPAERSPPAASARPAFREESRAARASGPLFWLTVLLATTRRGRRLVWPGSRTDYWPEPNRRPGGDRDRAPARTKPTTPPVAAAPAVGAAGPATSQPSHGDAPAAVGDAAARANGDGVPPPTVPPPTQPPAKPTAPPSAPDGGRPDVVNKSEAEAAKAIRDAGLTVKVEERRSLNVRDGIVLEQNPRRPGRSRAARHDHRRAGIGPAEARPRRRGSS